MSYMVKRTITILVTGISLLIAYCIYAFGRLRAGLVVQDDLKFWAITMLIFIGIGIGAMIIIQILFHILLSVEIAVKEKVRNEKCDDKAIEKTIKAEMVEDERDKLIELKATNIGAGAARFGMVLSLISLALGYPVYVMLNILFISAFAGGFVEGVAQLFFYWRGR